MKYTRIIREETKLENLKSIYPIITRTIFNNFKEKLKKLKNEKLKIDALKTVIRHSNKKIILNKFKFSKYLLI
jgi:hypothetical protein